MKNMFLAVCVLSISVSLFGGEKGNEVSGQLILNTRLSKDKNGAKILTTFGMKNLLKNMNYFDKKDLIRFYGEPFYVVGVTKDENIKRVKCTKHESCFFTEEEMELVNSDCQKVNFIPQEFFSNGSRLKNHGDVLMVRKQSISRLGEQHECEVMFKVDADCDEQKKEKNEGLELIEFLTEVLATPRHYQKDELELLAAGVLIKNNDGNLEYARGLTFQIKALTEELKANKEKSEELQTKLTNELALNKAATIVSLQSQLKNYRIGIGGLLAIIMLYVSYTQRQVIQSYIGA